MTCVFNVRDGSEAHVQELLEETDDKFVWFEGSLIVLDDGAAFLLKMRADSGALTECQTHGLH